MSKQTSVLRSKKVLVTGGVGFIGSHIVEELVGRGVPVIALDNLSTGRVDNVKHLMEKDNFNFVHGDIRDEKILHENLEEVDVIFHEAALANVDESMEMPQIYNDVNVNGTLNLLEAARRSDVEKVVFASSSSVYGENSSPLAEDAPLDAKSPYALTKLTAERYCLLYHELYGLGTVALRYFNVYGPRQDPTNPYAAVITKFMWRVSKGLHPEIYGDGEQNRDFVNVKDVVHANFLAATNKEAVGKTINIGTGVATDIKNLAFTVIRLFGNKELSPVYMRERKGDIRYNCANINLAKKILKYHPKVSLFEGLKALMTEKTPIPAPDHVYTKSKVG